MRAGTPESQAAALQAAFDGDVQPPSTVKLGSVHMPIWTALVRSRARDEWSEIDKHHCANLARCLYDVERISAELETEGDTSSNERGTKVVNPKHALLETLTRRAVGLTKLLHLHAGAIVENVSDLAHKRGEEKTARDNAKSVRETMDDDDDLLARPSRLQ